MFRTVKKNRIKSIKTKLLVYIAENTHKRWSPAHTFTFTSACIFICTPNFQAHDLKVSGTCERLALNKLLLWSVALRGASRRRAPWFGTSSRFWNTAANPVLIHNEWVRWCHPVLALLSVEWPGSPCIRPEDAFGLSDHDDLAGRPLN